MDQEGLMVSSRVSFAEHMTSIKKMWGQCSNTKMVDQGHGNRHMFGWQLQHQETVTKKGETLVVLDVLGVV